MIKTMRRIRILSWYVGFVSIGMFLNRFYPPFEVVFIVLLIYSVACDQAGKRWPV